MNEFEELSRDAIAYFFQLSNRIQTVFDNQLESEDITIKQLFLMIVIDSFDSPPGFSLVSERFGTSRQNVKQLALKLKKKGYIDISKDPNDSRYKRLLFTEEGTLFWEDREDMDRFILHKMFHNIPVNDLKGFVTTLNQIKHNLNIMEEGE